MVVVLVLEAGPAQSKRSLLKRGKLQSKLSTAHGTDRASGHTHPPVTPSDQDVCRRRKRVRAAGLAKMVRTLPP